MPVYSTTENFLDNYRGLNSWNRSYQPSQRTCVPNLSSYQFESNPALAQEVLAQAGPQHIYTRPGYATEVSNVARVTTEITHQPATQCSVPVRYRINEDCDPVYMTRPTNAVTQRQNIRIRYLEPPPPPTPPPIIIKERQLTPPPPAPPIVVRQIAKPPPTPPPLVIREKPPTPPVIPPPAVIEKVIPPPSPPPRQVIVERIPAPEKPREIIYEKWLPYKPVPERKVIVERCKTFEKQPAPKNLIIEYEKPPVQIDKLVSEEGVIRADPNTYLSTRPCGEVAVVDKITELPQPNTGGCYQSLPRSYTPSSNLNATTMNPLRSKSTMEHVSLSTPPPVVSGKGPMPAFDQWKTTYRSSYKGQGFTGFRN